MSSRTVFANETARPMRLAALVGVGALVLGVIGVFLGGSEQFFRSYLFAYLFWLGISLGALAFLALHWLTGSRWGLTVRRVMEAAAAVLPLMAVLFLPVVLGMGALFPWTHLEVMAESPLLQHKTAYLNTPFFLIRAVIYFVVWIALALTFNRLGARYAQTGDFGLRKRLQGLGALGLILYGLTMTFADVDWLMSLNPIWNSTIYGLLIEIAQILSALAFGILVLNLFPSLGLGRKWTHRTTPIPFQDLGALLLVFVMGWAYLAYFQFLIIWAGDVPREITWYLARSEGGWLFVGLFVVVFQFILPFLALLSIRLRHNLRRLSVVALLLLGVQLVNMFWQVAPSFWPGRLHIHWLDFVLPVAIGGLWLAGFLWALARRPALHPAEQAAVAPAIYEAPEQPVL